MVVFNCATGTLDPYIPSANFPWDRSRVTHLFRRTGFGVSKQESDDALGLSPQQVVNQVIDAAAAAPLSPEPPWAYWSYSDYTDFDTQRLEQLQDWIQVWLDDCVTHPLRARLTLFWHNHFVAEFGIYNCTSYMYQYHRLLQEHALGNFKNFVRDIGLTPAMLVYLNGLENYKSLPNENYARELYELFALGADNGYTQQDIEETARALTGWVNIQDFCGGISFNPQQHDDGPKTIFGQTGNWNYFDVIDILFEQRAEEVATFICTKLYTHFVHPEPDESIISGLAATLQANDWELEPVLRQLFLSEHFFDPQVMRTVIKSPIEYCFQILREGNLSITDDAKLALFYGSAQLGQELLNPINVAGWPGNRSWISTSTLRFRWEVLDWMMWEGIEKEQQLELLRELVISVVEDDTVNDPAAIAAAMVDFFIPGGLEDPVLYDRATTVFKSNIPQNYYDLGLWNLYWDPVPWQVWQLMQYIARLPEFQLQ